MSIHAARKYHRKSESRSGSHRVYKETHACEGCNDLKAGVCTISGKCPRED